MAPTSSSASPPVKILITGSSTGLGSLAARALASRGHAVHLHARSASRAEDARRECPEAAAANNKVFVADLSSLEETRRMAGEVSAAGPWDVIVHNAGVMMNRAEGGDYEENFNVNTVAPWVLTSLIDPPPRRYVFLGSDSHALGTGDVGAVKWRGGKDGKKKVGACVYGESKLQDIMMAGWFSRHFAERHRKGEVGHAVECTALDPGWVPTRMGGRGAPGDIDAGVATYVMLAEGGARDSGALYWRSSRPAAVVPPAGMVPEKQDALADMLAEHTGVRPAGME